MICVLIRGMEVVLMSNYVNQKYNPLFTNIVINRIYKYCEIKGYTVHSYNAEYDDVWFIASSNEDKCNYLFTMNSETLEITLMGKR